jgi:hypothetical protein
MAALATIAEEAQPLDLLIAVVVSRAEELLGLRDLLDGARTYLHRDRVAWAVVSNGLTVEQRGAVERILGTDGTVLESNAPRPGRGGMYLSISQAMLHGLAQHRFRALLKLDPDALITGDGLVPAVRDRLQRFPSHGLLGSYRTTCTGAPRRFRVWGPVFERERALWRPFLASLAQTDYEPGEHAQGGAIVYSAACVADLRNKGLLGVPAFGASKLAEEVIFSLLLRHAGWTIGSLVEPGDPLAISHRGLPLSVAAIRRQRRAVVHSVKFGIADRLRRAVFRGFRTWDRLRRS